MSPPEVVRLTVYPIKSLDGEARERVSIATGGSLTGDREYAVVDADGDYVNGKRTAAVHRLRSSVDLKAGTARLREAGAEDGRTFDLAGDALADHLSAFFDLVVSLRRDPAGHPDDTDAHGPTVVSTATLRTVASWFPECTPEGIRRRFRANVEVGGVPPFWEDGLAGSTFRLGGVRLRGAGVCRRCAVPTRDPDTGASTPGFRERFVERRRETLPADSPVDDATGHYRLTLNTTVPESERGESVAVGDPVEPLADPD